MSRLINYVPLRAPLVFVEETFQNDIVTCSLVSDYNRILVKDILYHTKQQSLI